MAKQRERNELECFKAEIRKLKSENRHLRKTLGRANKQARRALDSQESDSVAEVELEQTVEKTRQGCPKCAHELDKQELGSRVLITCTKCNYRTSYAKES